MPRERFRSSGVPHTARVLEMRLAQKTMRNMLLLLLLGTYLQNSQTAHYPSLKDSRHHERSRLLRFLGFSVAR